MSLYTRGPALLLVVLLIIPTSYTAATGGESSR